MAITKHKLSNGMEVILEENHARPVISFNALVKVGSAFETDKEAGMTHVIEHMIFKGTPTYPVGEIARSIDGQLTATLHMDEDDVDLAGKLLPILERKAGRLLANGFPTGVEVADAMVHGGPYPASTNFGATSVGTLSIRRFLRPVCYQNMPEAILPEDIR